MSMATRDEKIIALTKKYIEGNCTDEEMILLENWYLNWVPNKVSVSETELNQTRAAVFAKLPVTPDLVSRPVVIGLFSWTRLTAAAVFILLIGAGIFYYYGNDRFDDIKELELAGRHIEAGGNKAYLTLANGKRIALTDQPDGKVASEAGIKISKTADGALIYTADDATKGMEFKGTSVNKIETPNGGQYQIHLPDGTKIWLNAASTIKYAVNFTSGRERRVELTGEAYFDVAKDKKHPFFVKTSGQEVKVLGTHFNINCYKEEHKIKTTLIEGSVQVHTLEGSGKNEMLKPGQQSVLSGVNIIIMPADTEVALAWKNGLFTFKDEPLENIMYQIARWYDVEVVYVGDIASRHFEGTVSRAKNISEVLRKFQLTKNVHFKIEGRRITVMP